MDAMRLPSTGDTIDEAQLQRKAYFQHPEINRARTELFRAALDVHASWLKEVLGLQRFRDQVMDLGDNLETPKDMSLGLWQTLFMMVPVISSTFASLGRMLSGVPGQSIGWVLIDEAGQAPPQQAVGALHRAKRSVVVGDPIQILPVVTTSPSLIDHVMKALAVDERRAKDPSVQSVQTLADTANPYGCTIESLGVETRIGIPLWVHRRCLDPMFSLSNEIAYAGRMVHGNKAAHPRPHPIFSANSWIDSSAHDGGASAGKERQYLPSQGELIVEMLRRYLACGGDENELYVISPFKAVKKGLKERLYANTKLLAEASLWGQSARDQSQKAVKARAAQLGKWVRNEVGTVHTFQGRENATVVLVIGCDTKNRGAVSWAGSMPNILNVAVTRAKHNLFVIGPRELWCEQGYFYRMAKKLEVARSIDDVIVDPMTQQNGLW